MSKVDTAGKTLTGILNRETIKIDFHGYFTDIKCLLHDESLSTTDLESQTMRPIKIECLHDQLNRECLRILINGTKWVITWGYMTCEHY